MKKIVLMVAVVACVAFASQGVQASTVQVSVENVMQDDFVKIEVKEQTVVLNEKGEVIE